MRLYDRPVWQSRIPCLRAVCGSYPAVGTMESCSTRFWRNGTTSCARATRWTTPATPLASLRSITRRCAPGGPSTTPSSSSATTCWAGRWARRSASESCAPTTVPLAARLPMVVVTRTGGARLQEGMVALVQLARTADAAARHRDAGLLQLAVHAHPSTGGVLISFGAAADLRAAEAGATIGFAGPRVAEAALGSPLQAGSHTAERAFQAGWLDAVLEEGEEAAWIDAALGEVDRPLPTRPLPAWTDPCLARRATWRLDRGAQGSRRGPADRDRPSCPPLLVVGRAGWSRRRRAGRVGDSWRSASRGGRD